MLFSSAYATVMGILPPLITEHTAVISDELNHNCIINAIGLARPGEKRIYPHLDLAALERHLAEVARSCSRAIVVTDGVFSMRGDHAPLGRIRELIDRFNSAFAENALLVVDDSHGVGALGQTGRGTEEITLPSAADLLVATLGKAFGVNGGYVAGSATVSRYLRETMNHQTPASFALALSKFPRLGLAHLNTPLEPLKRLSAHGPRLWVKREDATGLGFGGKKYLRTLFVQAAHVVLVRRPAAAMRQLSTGSTRLHIALIQINNPSCHLI